MIQACHNCAVHVLFAVFLCWSPPCLGHFPTPRKALNSCCIYRKSWCWWQAGLRLVPHFLLQDLLPHSAAATLSWGTPGKLLQLTHPSCSSGPAPQAIPKEQHPSQAAFQWGFLHQLSAISPFSTLSLQSRKSLFKTRWKGAAMALVRDNIWEYLLGRGQWELMGGCVIFASSALFPWLLGGICTRQAQFPSPGMQSAEMHFL